MYIKIAPNFIRNFTDFFLLHVLPAKFSILIRFFLRHLKEKKVINFDRISFLMYPGSIFCSFHN